MVITSMKPKKEVILDYHKYISKISKLDKIENIVIITKEFLKNEFNIKYEYTFIELQKIIEKKRILPELQESIKELCEKFEHLEYRPTKPSKEEISRVKTFIKKIIKESSHKEMPKKDEKRFKKLMNKAGDRARKIKKNKEKQENISKKVKIVKQKIKKEIIKQAKKNMLNEHLNNKKDKEHEEIMQFISTSKDLNINIAEIRKELKDLGFQKEKIDFALEKTKK